MSIQIEKNITTVQVEVPKTNVAIENAVTQITVQTSQPEIIIATAGVQGPVGPRGFDTGTSGTSGTSGVTGTSGTSGIGSNGTSGTSGSNGITGAGGTAGSSGTSGLNGTFFGSSGTSGVSGSGGTSGTSGVSGSSGTSGISGSSGTSGVSGSSGTSGISGSSGTSGLRGDSLFALTGSKWATTNTIEITGSLTVSSSGTFTNIGPANFIGKQTITGSLNLTDSVNINSPEPSPLSIGDSFGGGKLAYILTPTDAGYDSTLIKGIVAATADESTTKTWTNAITASNDKVANGYDDWYLPSKDELNKLYLNKDAIGGFVGASYWSSTQSTSTNAWFQLFAAGGTQLASSKTLSNSVRAIRAFSIPKSALNIIGNTTITGSLNISGGLVFSDATIQTTAFVSTTYTTTSSLNLLTESLNAYTSSNDSVRNRILQTTASLNLKTGSFATTGSNTFYDNQTIVGNVTFPSSSFISTTNASGGLYLSALNNGKLYLNADGGEGDVIIGYGDNWEGSLKVIGNTILSGSVLVTDTIQGTGSIFLQPDVNDYRKIEIYNTAAGDTHIKAISGLTFLGNDINNVKIDDYLKRVSIDTPNGVYVSSSLNINWNPSSLKIGDSFQGGKIAYLYTPFDGGYDPNLVKGVIAAEADEPTALTWDEAMSAVYNKTTNEYDDWFLPNIATLGVLYTNKVAIGGFVSERYWSSEEYAPLTATQVNFLNGIGSVENKTEEYLVRAIRNFSIPINAVNITGNTVLSGSLNVSSSFTASLREGYVWVGDNTGKNTLQIATSSFGVGGGAGTSGTSGVSGTSGTSGQNGQSNTFFNYQAKTNTTTGGPGSGHIIWNNATQESATSISVSEIDQNGNNDDIFLGNIPSGSIIVLQDQASHTNYQRWTVGTGVDNTTYWTFPITLITSTYSFTNNQDMLFIISQLPQGTSGTAGTSGTSGTSGDITLFNAFTGSVNTYTSSNDSVRNRILQTTASLNTYTGSNDSVVQRLMQATASINITTGSLLRIYQTTASLNTYTGSSIGIDNGLMTYTASLKAAAIVSSSTQVSNYFVFAQTSSANTFYNNQTISGSLFVSSIAISNATLLASSSNLTLSSGSNLYIYNGGFADISGSLRLTGSLSVGFSAGTTEFQVLSTGVTIGNISTDRHLITGSLIVSASTNLTGSVTINESRIDTAWTSYTPTWVGTSSNPAIGNGTISGAYKVIGKTCFVRGRIAMGSTTTYGVGDWKIGLPVAAINAYAIQIPASLLDSGNGWYTGLMNGSRGLSTTYSEIQVNESSANTAVGISSIFPFTWGSSDELSFNGSYEIA